MRAFVILDRSDPLYASLAWQLKLNNLRAELQKVEGSYDARLSALKDRLKFDQERDQERTNERPDLGEPFVGEPDHD